MQSIHTYHVCLMEVCSQWLRTRLYLDHFNFLFSGLLLIVQRNGIFVYLGVVGGLFQSITKSLNQLPMWLVDIYLAKNMKKIRWCFYTSYWPKSFTNNKQWNIYQLNIGYFKQFSPNSIEKKKVLEYLVSFIFNNL